MALTKFFCLFFSQKPHELQITFLNQHEKEERFFFWLLWQHTCASEMSAELCMLKTSLTTKFYSSLLYFFFFFLNTCTFFTVIRKNIPKKMAWKIFESNCSGFCMPIPAVRALLPEHSRLLKTKARDWRWKSCKRSSNVKGKVIVLCFDSLGL